jgi:hypothetical protein
MHGEVRNISRELNETGKSSMGLSIHIAEAKDGKDTYQVAQTLAGGIRISHDQSGNDWHISLQSLLALAIKEGIRKRRPNAPERRVRV